MNGVGPHKVRLLAENRNRWEPGLNDPSFGSLAVTAGYAAAACFAFFAARRAAGAGFERRFWTLVCALLIALGINKQLDLHILLTDWGRAIAVDGGWYQQRRLMQQVFIVIAVTLGVAIATGGYFATRHRDSAIRLALAGLILIAGYVLARASVINHTSSGSRWDWLIELAGIAVIAFGARRSAS